MRRLARQVIALALALSLVGLISHPANAASVPYGTYVAAGAYVQITGNLGVSSGSNITVYQQTPSNKECYYGVHRASDSVRITYYTVFPGQLKQIYWNTSGSTQWMYIKVNCSNYQPYQVSGTIYW